MGFLTNLNDPLLQLFIHGKKELADLVKEFNISVEEKDAFTDSFDSSDGEVVRNVTGVSPLNILILHSDSEEQAIDLKLTVDDTVNPVFDIFIPMYRLFVYEVGTPLNTQITQLKYSTPDATKVKLTGLLLTYKSTP